MPYPYKGEPLVGKTNYIEWKTKVDLFLKVNGHMPYINGTKTAPDKTLYFKTVKDKDNKDITELYSPEIAIRYHERLTEYEDNQQKALGALKSIISIENIERFKTAKNALALYKLIIETFEKTSFE